MMVLRWDLETVLSPVLKQNKKGVKNIVFSF